MTDGRALAGAMAAALCLLLGLAAGSAGAETLRYGLSTPQGEAPEYKSMVAFKSYVEFRTDGKLQVRLFPGGQLGSERQMAEQVRDGALDMALAADGAVGGFFPKLQVFAIPYLFPSSPVAWEVLTGPFARRLAEEMRAATGIRVLAFSENGFRCFTNNRKPIRTPDDLRGLKKIRTMESPVFIEMIRAFGAAATPIGSSELILALQQNVVDGEENAPPVIHDFGIADVQKFMSLDEHVLGLHLLLFSDEVFQKLSPENRRIVEEAALVGAAVEGTEKARAMHDYIEKIKAKGVAVHVNSAAEKDLFRKASQAPVIAFIEKNVGRPMVDELLAEVRRAEDAVYAK